MVRPIATKQKIAYQVRELAEMVGGEVVGDSEFEVKGIEGLVKEEPATITFAENDKFFVAAEKSGTAVIIVPESVVESSKILIKVKNPRLAYARIAGLFAPQIFEQPGIAHSAVLAESAKIGSNVSIHPQVVIGEGAEVGDNVMLGAGVYLGPGVVIGANTVIHPNVVIEYNTIIGSNVIIHAGTVIGADGYGYVSDQKGHHKIPQLGKVIIEDEVEIGANVTIDRGTIDPTIIGKGTKIDNLVQIAHNVEVGSECLIIAQVGIAGSTKLGKRVILAGKTGVAGHLSIGENTVIASGSVVTKNTPAAVFYSGNPAHDHRAELREQAARRKLPDLLKRVKKLEEQIKAREE